MKLGNQLFRPIVWISVIAIIGISGFAEANYWHTFVAPLIAAINVLLILRRKKTAQEEIGTFFIFPIFMSTLLQTLISFFISGGQTTSIILSLLFIPISNLGYAYFIVKRKELSREQFGHMVTAIQSILFFSTIFGFFVQNPLLFDGFLVATKVGELVTFLDIPLNSKIASISIASFLGGLNQTLFIPYLFSASLIKGYVEYYKFVQTFDK